jgi:uncharacterized membrane protein
MEKPEEILLGSPDNPDTAAVVCYITLIGWLIAYFALYKNKKSDLSGFHLRQTLLLHIIAFIINVLTFLAFWHLFPGFIVTTLAILLLILWLIGLFNAVNNKQKPLPLLGNWAQRLFARI